MNFHELNLSEPILRALAGEGYTTPTPIQAKAIPHVLAGRDLLGCAQTGTGKTAAFALPIIHRLTHPQTAVAATSSAPAHAVATHATHGAHGHNAHAHAPARSRTHRPRVLVLTPTRELAAQIGQSFAAYGRHANLRHVVIYGGVGQGPQVSALRAGVDILVATPGRLLDLMNQGHVDLSHIETFVLDEGDNMLDMGFIHDIRRIVPELPAQRQTLMFSATMPTEIRKLANTILRDPVSVEVTPVATAAETVQQAVFFVDRVNKPALLVRLLKQAGSTRVLVFTRTKRGADKVARFLLQQGVKAQAIHGNKTQGARDRAMSSFKGHAPPVLVATDIAARGLDVDDISHVINFDVPNVPETYVHRIGRTGRAGAAGSALSLCDREERAYIRDIEKLMRKTIPISTDHASNAAVPANAHPAAQAARRPDHVASTGQVQHHRSRMDRPPEPPRPPERQGGRGVRPANAPHNPPGAQQHAPTHRAPAPHPFTPRHHNPTQPSRPHGPFQGGGQSHGPAANQPRMRKLHRKGRRQHVAGAR